MSTENGKVALEKLFHEVNKLQSSMASAFRQHNEFVTWENDFEEFRARLFGGNNELDKWVKDANTALNGQGPDGPAPMAPMSKEAKKEMAKQLAELDKLFDVARAATRDAIEKGNLDPQNAMSYLVDFLNRVLSSMDESNPYREVLKHLATRIQNGDEVGTLLDRARKVKPQKIENAVAHEVSGGIPDAVKALGGGVLGAALASVLAPMVANKVAQTDAMAQGVSYLQNLLAGVGASAETEEVEVEEDEIEVEDHVEVKNDVEITI